MRFLLKQTESETVGFAEMDGRKIEVETDSFLQTPFWAEVKAAEGWRPYFFDEDGGRILLLVRTLRRGLAVGYVPFGWGQSAVTPQSAAEKGRRWQKETGEPLFLVKWDFPLYTVFTKEEGIDPQFDFGIGAPLKKAVADIQPPDTTILDLTKSDEELFAAMHRKTRYNIKYAEKSGVRIREASADELPAWYKLYQTTAVRDKIAIHSEEYYRRILEKGAPLSQKDEKPCVKLYFAEHEGDLLAGNVVLFYKKQALYLYGASSNEKRNLMPAYLLQQHAIRAARDAGCAVYDFYGIPPTEDPHHPMHGLYRFKTGFGGVLIHRCGVYDAPVRPVFYALFRTAERARQFYFKRLRKRF